MSDPAAGGNAYPMGSGLIRAGKGPIKATGPMACMLCSHGHMTECHYPKTCSQAQSAHLARYMEDAG